MAKVNPKKITQPRHAKLKKGSARRGKKLWNDKSLGKSGLACSTCHVNHYASMQPTFAKPYPHYVKMAHDRAGMKAVKASEMVQLCMVVPMKAEPLGWNSQQLADLTAYVQKIRPGYKPMGGGNPCNPCGGGMANPCNPCGGR